MRLQNVIIRLTKYAPQNILGIRVQFIWFDICLKTYIYGPSSTRVKQENNDLIIIIIIIIILILIIINIIYNIYLAAHANGVLDRSTY